MARDESYLSPRKLSLLPRPFLIIPSMGTVGPPSQLLRDFETRRSRLDSGIKLDKRPGGNERNVKIEVALCRYMRRVPDEAAYQIGTEFGRSCRFVFHLRLKNERRMLIDARIL